MKQSDFFNITSMIDEAFLEEAMPRRYKTPRKLPLRWLTAAAAVLLTLGIGGGVWYRQAYVVLPDLTGKYERIYLPEEDNNDPIHIAGADSMMHYSIYYRSAYYVSTGKTVDGESVGELLFPVETGEVGIYRLRGVSDECAVAALMPYSGDYIVCVSATYLPDTTGTFAAMFPAGEALRVRAVRYTFDGKDGGRHTIAFAGYSEMKVLSYLLGKESTAVTASYEEIAEEKVILTVEASVPGLGCDKMTFSVTEDGTVYAELPQCRGTWHIGRRAVRGLLRYLTENGTGTEIVYKNDV